MDADGIIRRRLRAQRLVGEQAATPAEVVGGLLAVQAQDYGPAKWSLGSRIDPRSAHWSDAAVDRALADAGIIRTHTLRPTWHFVPPEDLGWLQALTGPRVHAMVRSRYRQLGLDEGTRSKATEVMAEALRGGVQLTRRQLAEVLERHGIDTTGQRMPFLLLHAELEAVLCSGGLAGRQHTFALVEERVPRPRHLEREAALAELVWRYLSARGPARLEDLRWWSSLTLADLRVGLDAHATRLESAEVDGQRWWWVPSDAPEVTESPAVHLLQGLDEYFVGYTTSDTLADTRIIMAELPGGETRFNHVLLDGRVAGHWKRTLTRTTVRLDIVLTRDLDDAAMAALHATAERFAEFLGLELEVTTRRV